MEALRLGTLLVARGADPGLACAAAALRAKIEAVLPDHLSDPAADPAFVHAGPEARHAAAHLPALRRAVREGLATRIAYGDAGGQASERSLRPLQLEFWGRVWTLAAWYDLRGDFRTFRLDRIAWVEVTDQPFPRDPGRGLPGYLARMSGH